MSTLHLIALVRRMGPRDPEEAHRVASPLELLAAVALDVAALGLAMPLSVLLIGLAMAGSVAQHVVTAQRRLAAAPQGGR